jgi:hypothetical protein
LRSSSINSFANGNRSLSIHPLTTSTDTTSRTADRHPYAPGRSTDLIMALI